CSIGWASDEQWGLYSKNDNYTCQYTVIGPANSWGGHAKGVHGFGIMLGRSNVSYDHNLIIHNVSRNFRGKVPDQNAADFTNNIIYDWGYQTTYGTIGHINYVNNTLKAGNSTTGSYHYAQVSNSDNFKVYLSGNRILNKDNSVRNNENSNWSAISYKSGKTEATTRVDTPFQILTNGEDVSTVHAAESAADSYEHVISYAGNGISPTQRTAIDQQCAEETKNGTGSCSGTAAYDSSVSDLTKYKIECGVTYDYPDPVLQKTITDNDNDGMDDDWELLRGLDPNDPSDTNGDYCGEGYTNIEYYINDLTVDAFPPGVVTPSPETANVPSISAFETIEAESFSSQSGIVAEDCTEGGQNIGYIENGDYVMFRKVDFEDGARSFTARIASAGEGGNIELYLDKLSGTPVATIPVAGTGNWQEYVDVTANIPAITGQHNLYLKFTGGESYLFNVNNFVFSKEAIPINGRLIKNLLIYDTLNPSDWKISDGAAVGSLIFADREVTYATLASELQGAETILTACDSKGLTDEKVITFEAGADITVYVAPDSRVTTTPSWLSGWEKATLDITGSNSVTFVPYQKTFKAGELVTIGGNGQSSGCVNYALLVKETSGVTTTTTTITTTTTTTTTTEQPTETTTTTTEQPTETTTTTTEQPTETTTTTTTTEQPTETTTTTTTTEQPTETTTTTAEQPTETTTTTTTTKTPVTELSYGDVNLDGSVTLLDVVYLNKYIAKVLDLGDVQIDNADCCEDNKINGSDVTALIRFLVRLVSQLPVSSS
ncbi:MAG: carbohydrate-binding protein, partial [Ruminococcus sp.]|nr:carbohydrate-binding protein [Ruminococcus sp.]